MDEEDYQTFSFAYRFATNQAGFLVRRYDVFSRDDCKPASEWLAKHDVSEWTPESRDFQKQWQQMVKDQLLSCRKDLLANTLNHFRGLIKAGSDAKEALKDLVVVEEEDADSVVNNFAGEFKKSKVTEKVWKSIKL